MALSTTELTPNSMLKLIVAIAIVYLILMAVTYFNQRSLIYQPSNRGLTADELESLGLKKWPTDDAYRGYFVDRGNVDKTFVLFHGNAGEAADRVHYLLPFERQNARVLLAEYPGYGSRPGSSSEELYVSDAIETLTQIAQAFPDEPLYVFGESLGTGISSAAVGAIQTGHTTTKQATDIRITGLGLITPFDSLVNVARKRYKFLPVRWLLKDQYKSAENLRQVTIPKALILSGQDNVVPIEHGRNLAQQLTEAKKTFTLESAGHSNWTDYVDNGWWDNYFDFLLQREQ